MSKVEKTSKKVASHAAKVLADKGSSKTAKQLAGSALSQRDPKKTTSPTVAKKAAKAMDRASTKKATKSIAGSVLTQAKPTAVKAARKKPAKGTGGVGPRGTGSGGIRGRD